MEVVRSVLPLADAHPRWTGAAARRMRRLDSCRDSGVSWVVPCCKLQCFERQPRGGKPACTPKEGRDSPLGQALGSARNLAARCGCSTCGRSNSTFLPRRPEFGESAAFLVAATEPAMRNCYTDNLMHCHSSQFSQLFRIHLMIKSDDQC